MAIYRGKVIQVDVKGIYVEIANLGIGMVFGPCQSIVGPLTINSFVLCVQVDGAKEDIIVIGELKNTSAVTTDTRPNIETITVGYQVFDSTLGKPIWFNGTGWVDAIGTVV